MRGAAFFEHLSITAILGGIIGHGGMRLNLDAPDWTQASLKAAAKQTKCADEPPQRPVAA